MAWVSKGANDTVFVVAIRRRRHEAQMSETKTDLGGPDLAKASRFRKSQTAQCCSGTRTAKRRCWRVVATSCSRSVRHARTTAPLADGILVDEVSPRHAAGIDRRDRRDPAGRRASRRRPVVFWTEQYDFGLAYVGHAERFDHAEIDGQLGAKTRKLHDHVPPRWRKLAVAIVHRDLEGLRAEVEFERMIGLYASRDAR